ncbi:MAG: tetratricopeptide repeat protein [Acidobacteria bacterium]|nr:tetratricopeptide repeat protein [Acidobacteriota bacterium]
MLVSDPDSLLAHYNLGFIAQRSRRYDEAETHLRHTIRLSPRHPEAHYRLGLTYLVQKRVEEAIAALEQAVEIDPDHVGAHFNLANAFARAGRMSQAEKYQRRYAELSGRSEAEVEIKTQIATLSTAALQHEMNERFSEALAEYEQLAEQFSDHAPLYERIGRLRMKLGRPQEALAALKRAIDLNPRLSDAHYLLAALYRQMGDREAADRELEVFAVLETIPEGKSGY